MEHLWKEQQIECLGLRINYIDAGQGEVMLLLHNGGGFWQVWVRQLAHFVHTHRVIALDLPGFGASDMAEELPALEFNYGVLRAFVETLGIRQFTLVGNCIGASIALQYYYRHPDTINRLVLMNMCPGERLVKPRWMKYPLFRMSWPPFRCFLYGILHLVATRTPFQKKFPGILFGSPLGPGDYLYDKYVEKFKEERQTRARIRLLFALETYTLQRFVQPGFDTSRCLLLWGARNRVAALENEGYYHRRLAGIERFEVIDGAGHLTMYEAAAEVNRLIEDFEISKNGR